MTNEYEYAVSNETVEATIDSDAILESPGDPFTKQPKEETESVSTGKTDYKFIIDMIKEMEEQYKLLKDVALSQAEVRFNLTKDVYTGIIPITEDDIKTMTESEMKKFLSKYLIEDQQLPANNDDEVRNIMTELKTMSLQLLSSKKDIDDIKKESNNMMKDYFNYLSSPMAQEKRANRLKALKEAVEKTDDEDKKKSMMRMITTMEEAQNLSFLFTRFDTLGDKEIKSIVDSFFDRRRGAIVVDRFKLKIKKFGFDSLLYRYFFNLEENFLDEQYHAFNNLFLFIYMRFVSHADPYNKKDVMFVQSLTSSLANLVYHKFNSISNEDDFKNIIQKVVDKFMKYHDKFESDNSTHPTHPVRIEIDNKKQQERRKALIAKMEELKITGYDENASADELQEYLNTELEKMINNQIEAKKEAQVDDIEPTDDDDSSDGDVIDVEPVDNN